MNYTIENYSSSYIMPIIVKNKDTLIFDDFIFKCCLGKND